MRATIFHSLLAVLLSQLALGQGIDKLILPDGSASAGESLLLPMSVAGPSPVVAMQFDILFTKSTVDVLPPVNSGNSNHNVMSREVSEGLRRVVVYSRSNAMLPKDVVIGLPMVMSSTVAGQSSPKLQIQGLYFTLADGTRVAAIVELPDTTTPAAPQVILPANGAFLNTNLVMIQGLAETLATVTLTVSTRTSPLTVTADANGIFGTGSLSFDDGVYTLTAVATDAAGNTSPISPTTMFTVDTVHPPAPQLPEIGSVVTSTPTFSGLIEPGSTITFTITPTGGGAPITFSATADANGNFVATAPMLADGSYTITAIVRDQAGNASTPSATQTFPVVTDRPPTANAGADRSVNEGELVALDGTLSSDPDEDPLTYLWEQIPGGALVALSHATTAQPTFTAPTVALGGETLSFYLTVTANGETSTDTVSVTVVNINHPPVAEAGNDQSIAEASPVTLHGENSFDIDIDPVTYAWIQVANGSPTVTLAGANSANPSFTAPVVGTSGAPGVVATLEFELRVADGYPPDAPAPGYSFENVVDRAVVRVTNVNNGPTARAGADQIAAEHSAVALTGVASSDPDSDGLVYAWAQVPNGAPMIALTGATTATPRFVTPFVSAGGADLLFDLAVDDGYGGIASDRVVIHVQNINDPPLASTARPTTATLWPANHGLVAVGITGVTDPNNNATITITKVTQDEPTNGQGDGDTAIDAVINNGGTVLLRAERSGNGDGRVYRIYFTASDLEGSASGMVVVTVPHSAKKPAKDSGGVFDSTR